MYLVGRKTISVIEYTFRLLLALIVNIVHIDYLLKYTNELTRVNYEDKMGVRTITSEWSIDSKVPFFLYSGPVLHKKKIAIIGYDTIRIEVAKHTLVFDMELLISKQYQKL